MATDREQEGRSGETSKEAVGSSEYELVAVRSVLGKGYWKQEDIELNVCKLSIIYRGTKGCR